MPHPPRSRGSPQLRWSRYTGVASEKQYQGGSAHDDHSVTGLQRAAATAAAVRSYRSADSAHEPRRGDHSSRGLAKGMSR